MQETNIKNEKRLAVATTLRRSLLVHLGLGGPCAQVPAAAALVIPLMLNGNLAEMTKNVLHLGVGSGSGFTAQVVQPCDAVHEVVDNGNHNLVAELLASYKHDLIGEDKDLQSHQWSSTK